LLKKLYGAEITRDHEIYSATLISPMSVTAQTSDVTDMRLGGCVEDSTVP
jgi:hypothetical protein